MSDIIKLPYEQRRVVAIVENVGGEPPAPSVADRARAAAKDIGPAGGAALAGLAIFSLPVALAAGVGVGARSLFGKKDAPRDFGGALAVTPEQARRELVFPPGHPQLGHAYAGHPLVPARYLPFAAFHRMVLEEQSNELMNLLASLGATRVRVLHRTGYRMSASGEVGFGDDGKSDKKSKNKGSEEDGGSASTPYSVDAKAKGGRETNSEVMFEEHYRPQGEPYIPTDLVWYGQEASWQAVAQRRLKFRTTKFQAKLNYSDSFGIDASLKAKIEGVGLKLGGSFHDFQSTTWEFEGEFA